MFQIEKTLVSKSVLEKQFVCDLSACKGACCVQGEGGAPLTDDEILTIEDNLEEIKPYMNEQGLAVLNEEGVWYRDSDGEKVTTLVNKAECSFVFFEEDGTAKCSMEKAYNEGKTEFLKPMSCHLYPIRIREYRNFTAVNFHKWEICEPACACGNELEVPVYRFLKEPLIRKFGEEYFDQLVAAQKLLSENEKLF
ncbi:MAG: DUF3109 family protein [Salibacteraceae bacterium]